MGRFLNNTVQRWSKWLNSSPVDGSVSGVTGATIDCGNGGEFGTHPSSDTVEIISDDASESVTVHLIVVSDSMDIVQEDIVSDGTNAVASSLSDLSYIMAAWTDTAPVGTITVRAQTGPTSLCSLASGNYSRGRVVVDVADQRAWGREIVAYSDSGSHSELIGALVRVTGAGSDSLCYFELNDQAPVRTSQDDPYDKVKEIYPGAFGGAL